MIRAAILALALSALSLCWHPAGAQQQPCASAAFASQLASLIVGTLEERDQARAQLAACQAPKSPAAPGTPPAQNPEGAPK